MRYAWVLLAVVLALPGRADFPDPENLAAVTEFCQLSPPGVQRLRENGLVVSPGFAETNLYAAYYRLELQGEPMYITADAMLYLWYEAQREAMLSVEQQYLRPQLIALVGGLLEATRQQPAGAANAVTLAVTRQLLEPGWEIPADLRAPVEAEVTRVMAHTLVQDYPGDDYTQYEVRGYYTKSEESAAYFRGAKYLARRYFAVGADRAAGDLTRAVLLAAALREGQLGDLYRQIRETREFLAGPVDSIGLDQLLAACDRVWGAGWSVERATDLTALRAELNSERYPRTRVNNRMTDPDEMMTRDRWVAVLGEHYLPDSELFHRTTEPEVPNRHLPSGLDVATALGSASAAVRLADATAEFPPVVPNARAFGQTMQYSGVYGAWLQTLGTLWAQPAGLPLFARGAAYQDKQLNTCLTSWAQLRHNYLLYGAQAYTVAAATQGAGIVEPLPDFWGAYAEMCRGLRERLVTWKAEPRPVQVLQRLEDEARLFQRCASDQLAGKDTSWAARDIHEFASLIQSVYFDSPLVVADVAASRQTGDVLEAASGSFHPVVVLVEAAKGTYAAVGWVGSYYEWAEPNLGRLTDEAWQQRVGATYARPEPPAWLAGLYAPASAEEGARTARLAALESGLRQNEATGRAQLEAAIAADPHGPLAPSAALILGKYLLEAKRYAEAEAALASAQDMYGGDARDQALQLLSQAQWNQQRLAREAKAAAQLAADLAATDPRPGLTPAQDKERQNRRAEVLLGAPAAGGFPPDLSPPAASYLQQAMRECPDSDYLPFVEITALRQPWTAFRYEPDSDERGALARQQEPLWTALAKKYAGSRIGQVAQVGAAGLAHLAGDTDRALREVLPLLAVRPPAPEAYPQSVAWLGKRDWETPAYAGLDLDPQRVAQGLIQEALPAAYYAGNLTRAQELLGLARRHGVEIKDGYVGELIPWLDLFGTGPDAVAFARWQAAGQDRSARPSPASQAREALALADRYPKSPVAPAVLLLAHSYVEQSSGSGDLERPLRERLAAYPNAPEYLLVQMEYLVHQERFAEAEPLYRRLVKLAPEDQYWEDRPWWVRELGELRDPAQYQSNPQAEQARTAAQWRRWGKLLTAAGLSEGFLKNQQSDEQIAEGLTKRLPDRQVEIALTLPDDEEGSGGWLLRKYGLPALRAHPDDPRAMELRWRLGDVDSLLAIVAAGPATPHYAEAATRFETLAVESEPRRGSGLRARLQGYGDRADRYRGTPAEALALAQVGQTYLSHERPEEAADFLVIALARVAVGAAFRDRLTGLQTTARAALAAKRHEGIAKLWETPLSFPASEWSYDRREALPTLVGDHLVLAERTAEGTPQVAGLEIASGRRVWALPGVGAASLAAAAEAVIVGTDRGSVLALDSASGRVAWQRNLGLGQAGRVWVIAAGDRVAAYWEQGLLAALDAQTGAVRWQVDVLAGPTAPLLVSGQVVVQDHAGDVQAWRLADGARSWTWQRSTVMTAEYSRGSASGVAASLAVAGGRVLVVVSDGPGSQVVGLRAADGSLAWQRPAGMNGGLVTLGAGDDFPLLTYERLEMCSAADGKTRWTVALPEHGGDSLRLLALGSQLVLGQGARLRLVDRRTGTVLQELTQAGERAGLAGREGGGQVRLWVVGGSAVTAWSLQRPTP
ncbi:MAG TPA: DUF3160 domain-containing protein [Armatimonadota bacterium]|jgi:outer membrane protein assembly factor BamB